MATPQQQFSRIGGARVRQAQALLSQDFVRFCIVGAIGFAINLSVLFALHTVLNLSIVVAQIVGAELAILSNFFFHSTWTYQNYVKMPFAERIVKFHATYIVGAAINSLTVILTDRYLDLHYVFGLMLGSSLSLVWNYVWTKYHIWAREDDQAPQAELAS